MPHLHLSVQAGADLILKRMRRRHLRADALAVIARARALRPGHRDRRRPDRRASRPKPMRCSQQTLDFVREADLPYLHVFPYSERPGTPAARMPRFRAGAAARTRRRGCGRPARADARHASMRPRSAGRVQVLAERGGGRAFRAFPPVRRLAAPRRGGALAGSRCRRGRGCGLEAA